MTDDVHALIAQARQELVNLENRLKELERIGNEKDLDIERLIAERSVAWFYGASSKSVLAKVLNKQVYDSSLHVFTIDNKYFTVDILINQSENLDMIPLYSPHAVVLAMDDGFDVDLANGVFARAEFADIKLVLCNDAQDQQQRVVDWCVDNEVEYIPWSESVMVADRVLEALSTSMWPDAVIKPPPSAATVAAAPLLPAKQAAPEQQQDSNKREFDAEASLEEFERILAQAKQVQQLAVGEASDEARRMRAAEAAMQMLQFLGNEDESSDEEK